MAAGRLRDARILLLSLAFFAVSGFSTVHALLTPDVFFPFSSTGLGWTQVGGYVLGGLLLAVSSLPLPTRVQRWLLRSRNALYAGMLAASLQPMLSRVRSHHERWDGKG